MNDLLTKSCAAEKRDFLFGLIISLTAFLVYANSLGNGFAMDDLSVLLNNPTLRGTPLSLFSSIDTTSDTQLLPYYRPLTLLTFLLEDRLHGFTPFLVRLFNVLLHCVNSFLVYRLAGSLLTNRYAALLAGLLFALHPLNTESVDYNAGGRNTMLACLFILLTYLCHHRSVVRNQAVAAFLGAVFFLMGLFCKETTLALAPFIAALEINRFRTVPNAVVAQSVKRLLPYAVAGTVYLVMRWITLSSFRIQTTIIPGLGTEHLESLYAIPDLATRLSKNLYIIPRYLLTIVWPSSLTPVYVLPDDLGRVAVPLAAGWVIILVLFAWLVTRGRSIPTLFGLSWLTVFWLPVSGLVYFPSTPMADRFLYVAAIGLWIIVADQVSRLSAIGETARRYSLVVVSGILVTLGAITLHRNPDWKDDITLFTRMTEQYPSVVDGHAYLGISYYAERETDRRYLDLAEKELKGVLDADPNYRKVFAPMALIRMGDIQFERGDYPAAIDYYTKALTIAPRDQIARVNRGLSLEKLGRYDEAVADYEVFLGLPGYDLMPDARAYARERIGVLRVPGSTRKEKGK